MSVMAITVTAMTTRDDAAAFDRLNRAWIEQHFTMEDADRATLEDPFAAYVEPGGAVLLARDGDEVIGTCALLPHGEDWELSKMTVAAHRRGEGLGAVLIAAVVARARQLGIGALYLETNHALGHAIALYEAAGFRHVTPSAASPYARADVFMRMEL